MARSMKNTGFKHLRIVRGEELIPGSYVTAVHAEDILENAQFFPDLERATRDLDAVFAATAKMRKNFSVLSLDEAVDRMLGLPSTTRLGLVFGNERTGLTSRDLLHSNFGFTIPQARRQPSYNLGSAVLLTLFCIFTAGCIGPIGEPKAKPLSRKEQEDCIHVILDKLEKVQFIHRTNRRHMTEMITGLLGRLCMTEKDRRLLLALFSKGVGSENLRYDSRDKR